MIRIRELYRLKNIHNLRLIAGEAGLERTLTAAVLFEYDPSRMQLPDFYRGDLVVTTLAYARGEEQLVAPSLLALMDQVKVKGVSHCKTCGAECCVPGGDWASYDSQHGQNGSHASHGCSADVVYTA